MGAGKRQRRITIQRATFTRNAMNEKVPTWATHDQPFAEVQFGSAGERRVAAAQAGDATATFIVLHTDKTSAVTVEDRISFDGSIWNIGSNVPSLKLNRRREITATRATNG